MNVLGCHWIPGASINGPEEALVIREIRGQATQFPNSIYLRTKCNSEIAYPVPELWIALGLPDVSERQLRPRRELLTDNSEPLNRQSPGSCDLREGRREVCQRVPLGLWSAIGIGLSGYAKDRDPRRIGHHVRSNSPREPRNSECRLIESVRLIRTWRLFNTPAGPPPHSEAGPNRTPASSREPARLPPPRSP
jgi:hypothetical protein